MNGDHITQIRISGMRALGDVILDLDGLTVLIGENGSGKSTIIEAFELIRKTVKPGNYVLDSINNFHGGINNLLRQGQSDLSLAVVIEGGGPKMEYGLSLMLSGTGAEVRREWIDVWTNGEAQAPFHALDRNGADIKIRDIDTQGWLSKPNVLSNALAISSFGMFAQPVFLRLTEALKRVAVHTAFDTRPFWIVAEAQQRTGMRWPAEVDQAETLGCDGGNLANCFLTLRNRGAETWERVLAHARLGLGDDLREIGIPSPHRGDISLELQFGKLSKPVPVTSLSDGQLAFLGMIALTELAATTRSIIVLDEPELHLHPALLTRVVWMIESAGKNCPVVVATHSDRFLDALEEPAKSVVLCELDEQRAVKLRRPNAERLKEWLEEYRGIGSIRAEGYESHLFVESAKNGDENS